MKKETAASLSFAGTFILIAAVGFGFAPLDTIWSELALFFGGHATAIARVEESLLVMLPVAFVIISLDVAVSLPVGILTNLTYLGKGAGKRLTLEALTDPPKPTDPPGKIESFLRRKISKLSDLEEDGKERSIFQLLFWTVLFEELYARALFLGVLTKVFPGTTAFYVLLLVGNGTWALAHVFNHKKGERHPIRVLSQFLGGFFHSYVFVKYGLMMCFFTHFAYNASLFSFHKRRDVDRDNVVSMTTSVLAALGIWGLMTRPLEGAAPWVEPRIDFHLDGWTTWDLALLSVFASFSLKAVMDVLLYDRKQNDTEALEEMRSVGYGKMLAIFAFVVLLVPFAVWVLYWVGGLFFDDTPGRVLFACLPFALTNKNASLSAAMRVFWVTLPNLYALVCITKSAGPLAASAVLCLEVAVAVPIFFAGKLFKRA